MRAIVTGMQEARKIVLCNTGPEKRAVHRRHRRWARQQLRRDELRLADPPKTCVLTSWDIA
jgi:hypothetical protein